MVTLRSGTRLSRVSESLEEDELNHREIFNGLSCHTPNEKEKKSPPKHTETIVFISLLLDLLGFTVILPLFPALLDYYSHNDSSGLYGSLLRLVSQFQDYIGVPSRFNSVLFGGLLGSLFSLLQFLSSPIIGALSDVYGRKVINLITLVGIAASYGIWAVSSNFAVFVLARVVGGLSKGNISLAYTIMTDVSNAANRTKGMALIGIAFSIGFIIGPAIGAGFSKWGSTGWFASSALYALVLAILNIVYFSIFFKETLPKHLRSKSLADGVGAAFDYINPISLFSFKAVKGLELEERNKLKHLGKIYFLFLFFYSGLEFTLTFVTHHQHNYSSMDQGWMFVYLGLMMALMQGGFVRRAKNIDERDMVILGFILMIPAFIIIGFSSSSTTLYLGLTLYAFGSSIMVPCLTAIASKIGPESQKGTIVGIWRSLGALARAFGPVILSSVFWILGAGGCYTTFALLLIIPLAMFKYSK